MFENFQGRKDNQDVGATLSQEKCFPRSDRGETDIVLKLLKER
jgi:hypothetical protein